MTALSIRNGHELDKKWTDRQLECDLSFESVDKLDIVKTS